MTDDAGAENEVRWIEEDLHLNAPRASMLLQEDQLAQVKADAIFKGLHYHEGKPAHIENLPDAGPGEAWITICTGGEDID